LVEILLQKCKKKILKTMQKISPENFLPLPRTPKQIEAFTQL